MKRLSVIIPGYNTRREWWARSVRSALAACPPDGEIIVVDDGSTMDTRFLDAFPVRVLHLKGNQGLSSARNAALAEAEGEYVTFVDSDDEVRSETYFKCLEQIQKTKADICIYGVNPIWPLDGWQKHDVPACCDYGILLPREVHRLYRACLFNYSCNKVYRKAFLDENKIRFNKDGMPCEDIIFNLHCLLAKAKWCSVDYEGYVYYKTYASSVAVYRSCHKTGTRMAAQTWAAYCDANPEARSPFAAESSLSDASLLWSEWMNIWRPHSPYSLLARWRWLKENARAMKVKGCITTYVRMAVFMFIRSNLYIRPLRIWNLKQQYDNLERLKG